ncbi:MAG: sirohydrochlorin chelatase [Microcoleus sp. SIO2G3]|nr:sirohydrochlorin chelatase [Microcoleus sp. SIO2G3]
MLSASWPQRVRSPLTDRGSIALLDSPPLIATACLELAPQPLHQQIQQIARQAIDRGDRRLVILPLFLLAGVHVRGDLPAEVKLAQQALGSAIELHLCSHLGSHPGLEKLLAQSFTEFPRSTARILLAHGSRRTLANREIANLAQRLQAVSAYWSVAPSLSDRLQELTAAGHRQIAIVPYFLFAGGITDAIAQTVNELAAQLPDCDLYLGEPLGATLELADIAIDLLSR